MNGHTLNWWHTIELPDGTVFQGQLDYRGEKGKRFLLPENLEGKRVIDFGAWDGYWAIEAKRRGAKYVLAVDRWDQVLNTAEIALGAYDIPYRCSGDLDFPMSWNGGGELFDVVLFYGILYHLKNPYMGLWNAVSVCAPGGTVIVESAVNQGAMEEFEHGPAMVWVIDEVHHNDPTNYHMPNTRGLIQLCKLAGLVPCEVDIGDRFRMTVRCEKPGD
jgi:2-polyprenyl-3-methyl-5-hydroxy-6-metoxy-1,4-benzoquinol methylase